MKALRYYGPHNVRFDDMPDPILLDDRDAIVRVDRCAICGSDLHIYHGSGFSEDLGFCIGHEAVGEVVEIGRGVRRLKTGDQVMMSAAVGCGACASCLAGNVVNCANDASACYGLGHQLQGSQAQLLRVPAADFNAVVIPDGISKNQGLMLTDALATAWFGCRNADVAVGGTVAVVGLGPIGLMAVEAALLMGAARVFAIDLMAERRVIAEAVGAVGVHPTDAVAELSESTSGRMAESVIEAVGADATIALALNLAGKRACVSVIGVSRNKKFVFPMHRAFAKGLTFRIGTCSVQQHWPELIPLVQAGRLRPERYISHELPLQEGARAYEMLDSRSDKALKVIMLT